MLPRIILELIIGEVISGKKAANCWREFMEEQTPQWRRDFSNRFEWRQTAILSERAN